MHVPSPFGLTLALPLALAVATGCTPPQAATTDAGATVAVLADTEATPVWFTGPELPKPVANNAVVGLEVAGEAHVYSFLGIDESKQWDGVVDWAFRWVMGSNAWEELAPVPGQGRLAATAEAWGGKVYLFGGYTVAADGSESSVPNVDVFDPATDTWSAAAPIPTPVDDAVSGVWRDSLIVLVSGWHDTDNVADVQLYDPRNDSWAAATPIPGVPVFGHAGKVVGDHIVYLGGANTRGERPRYQIESSSWMGELDPLAPDSISWTALEPHPDTPRYRAASAAVGEWTIFAGGTDNPYNYNGLGYDGEPSSPTSSVFAFHTPTAEWVIGPPLPEARMDHRALALAGDHVVLVGGMDDQQAVRSEVFVMPTASLVRELRADLPPGQ